MSPQAVVEDLLRRSAPRALTALVRRYGHFDACEDAVQEALLAATVQWPRDGIPDDPGAWLVVVAGRRLTDSLRSEAASTRREAMLEAQKPVARDVELSELSDRDDDDSLTLLFLCCHPALSPPSQLALTLRALGGLTTAEIARAFLVPEVTMAQRISRAKQLIRAAGATFVAPAEAERAERLSVVLHVLYLMFNEGYAATEGADLQRRELTSEAIRIARMVRLHAPSDGEVDGLLALMLLTDARSAARTTADGALVPLAEQDRSTWDSQMIDEGTSLISDALARAPIGPYQVQAAIAAVHAEAAGAADTDWRQIVALYELLTRLAPSPMVTVNHAVAVAMAHGPRPGLAMLEALDADTRVAAHHRLHAVRGHLLEMAGDGAAAQRSYRLASRQTTSLAERRYLDQRATRST